MPTFNDRILGMILKQTPFYPDGWGDAGLIREVMDHLARPDDPPEIKIHWTKTNGSA